MKNYKIILIILCPLLFACSGDDTSNQATKSQDSLVQKQFKWPEGKYLFVDSLGYYYEEWLAADSGVYNGAGYFLDRNGTDTIFSMTMKLRPQKDNTVMLYNVKGKDAKEREFKLTKEDNNFFVFENPFHDFPSIMNYKIMGYSYFEVKEEGFVNGQVKMRDFIVRKIN